MDEGICQKVAAILTKNLPKAIGLIRRIDGDTGISCKITYGAYDLTETRIQLVDVPSSGTFRNRMNAVINTRGIDQDTIW
jgi:hypothetical protein